MIKNVFKLAHLLLALYSFNSESPVPLTALVNWSFLTALICPTYLCNNPNTMYRPLAQANIAVNLLRVETGSERLYDQFYTGCHTATVVLSRILL